MELIRLFINATDCVYINPNHITKMEELSYGRTLIYTIDGTATTVSETPEEIIDLIRRINHVL